MASQPLPRFLEREHERRQHIAALTSVVASTSLDLADRKIVNDPADTHTLRGIPAIGRGVAGCIRGTAPGPTG